MQWPRTHTLVASALGCFLSRVYIILHPVLQQSRMDENPANQMNFDELSGHCKVLSAKLAQLTTGNSAASTAVEDLEDYYERALQLRVMANQTLREQLREVRDEHAAFLGSIARTVLSAAVVVALVLAYFYPRAALHFVSATWSYILVAAATAVAVRNYRVSLGRKRT